MKKRDLNMGEYNIGKYQYRMLYNFCLSYPDMRKDIRAIEESGAGQRDGKFDSTANAALRLSRLKEHVEAIEKSAIKVDPECYKELIKAVTFEHPLEFGAYPRGEHQFRAIKKKFYYELSKHF